MTKKKKTWGSVAHWSLAYVAVGPGFNSPVEPLVMLRKHEICQLQHVVNNQY